MATSTNWLPLSCLPLGQPSLPCLFSALLPCARCGFTCGLRLTRMRRFLFLLSLWHVLRLVSIPFGWLRSPVVGTPSFTPSLALFPPSGPSCLAKCLCRHSSMLVSSTAWPCLTSGLGALAPASCAVRLLPCFATSFVIALGWLLFVSDLGSLAPPLFCACFCWAYLVCKQPPSSLPWRAG